MLSLLDVLCISLARPHYTKIINLSDDFNFVPVSLKIYDQHRGRYLKLARTKDVIMESFFHVAYNN